MPKAIAGAPDDTVRAAAFAARIQKRRKDEFALNLDITVPDGFTILFGPSGAGKTTFLDCIAGMAAPDAGSIRVGSRVFFDSGARVNLPVPKRNLGYVFQDLALFPHLTVEANVATDLTAWPPPNARLGSLPSSKHSTLPICARAALATSRGESVSGSRSPARW